MKILLTTIYAYPPRGGLGKYMHELKTGLEQQGHTVHILARDHGEYCITKGNRQYPLKRKRSGTRKISVLPSNWIGNQAWKYLGGMRDEATKFFDAVKMVDISQYQIIHAQEIVSASILNSYKPRTTPLILTVHGCVTAEYYYYGYIKPNSTRWDILSTFETKVIQQCAATIVPSKWLLDVYKKCAIPTDNMKVITNGIDVAAFQRQMSKKTGLKNSVGKSIIICTGRLEKVKGQHVLLDALANLKKRRSDWVCWIVGRGKNARALKKKAKRLGLDGSVKFLGMRSDIPALLKQADIFVIPSLQDNYPYSLVEAFVAGKAIIGSRVGGITEMVEHSKNGFLVPPDDSRALYKQMRKLLEKPNMQKRLSEQAKSWGMTQFSLKKMTKEVLDTYYHALKSKAAVRSEE
ncbi:MAG: glycosyltransferase family 4 protein [Bacillota bacterium]